jgi:Uma2 family endonuclease
MRRERIGFIEEETYLEIERRASEKSEYFAGEMFAMAGASERHNLIVANLIFELKGRLKNTPCRVYPGDMRLKIDASGLYTYPDVMVVCGERRFADENDDTLRNPDIIVEVLSDSTERYDRGVKFGHYRKLESLKEYLLVSQNSRKIERYFKNENGNWELTETDDRHPSIRLAAIACELDLDGVYDGIALPGESGSPSASRA